MLLLRLAVVAAVLGLVHGLLQHVVRELRLALVNRIVVVCGHADPELELAVPLYAG